MCCVAGFRATQWNPQNPNKWLILYSSVGRARCFQPTQQIFMWIKTSEKKEIIIIHKLQLDISIARRRWVELVASRFLQTRWEKPLWSRLWNRKLLRKIVNEHFLFHTYVNNFTSRTSENFCFEFTFFFLLVFRTLRQWRDTESPLDFIFCLCFSCFFKHNLIVWIIYLFKSWISLPCTACVSVCRETNRRNEISPRKTVAPLPWWMRDFPTQITEKWEMKACLSIILIRSFADS